MIFIQIFRSHTPTTTTTTTCSTPTYPMTILFQLRVQTTITHLKHRYTHMQINKIIAHTESTTLKLKTQQNNKKKNQYKNREKKTKSKYGSPLQVCHRVSNIYIYYIVDDAIYLQCKMSRNQTERKETRRDTKNCCCEYCVCVRLKWPAITSVWIAHATQHASSFLFLSIFNSIVTSFTNFDHHRILAPVGNADALETCWII